MPAWFREQSTRSWGVAVGIVLLVGLVLRLNGLRFGLPALNDPDELMFQMGAIRLFTLKTLNPGWFGHPATTTIYALAILDTFIYLAGTVFGFWSNAHDFATVVYNDPTWLILPGRAVMVGFGLWSVWLTFRLGRELFDHRVGLGAALLVAISPLHVAYSQVIRSDIMATCFMLLSLLAALRFGRGGAIRDLILASVWVALATITKWPFALSCLGVVGMCYLRLSEGRESFASACGKLIAFAGLAIMFVIAFSPFLVIDYAVVISNLQGEAQTHHLGASGGTALQNFWWYASGPFPKAFGVVGCLLTMIGIILIFSWREASALLSPVICAFVLILISQSLVWERWMLPLLPFFALLAASGATALLRWAGNQQGPAALALLALTAVGPIGTTLTSTAERVTDTRQIASRWARDHIPPESRLLVEHFGFDMLAYGWDFSFPMGDAGCVDARKMLAGKIAYSTIGDARGQRSNVDYGTLNPALRSSCRADYAILTQYDRYAAEKALFPKEYAAYQELLKTGEILATFRPVPGEVGGPIVRIVRLSP